MRSRSPLTPSAPPAVWAAGLLQTVIAVYIATQLPLWPRLYSRLTGGPASPLAQVQLSAASDADLEAVAPTPPSRRAPARWRRCYRLEIRVRGGGQLHLGEGRRRPAGEAAVEPWPEGELRRDVDGDDGLQEAGGPDCRRRGGREGRA